MRTQSVAVTARSVIEHAGRSSMMIAGRGVAAKRAYAGHAMRGHDAEAAAALRRHVEQPALDLRQPRRAGALVLDLRYTSCSSATSNQGAT